MFQVGFNNGCNLILLASAKRYGIFLCFLMTVNSITCICIYMLFLQVGKLSTFLHFITLVLDKLWLGQLSTFLNFIYNFGFGQTMALLIGILKLIIFYLKAKKAQLAK